MAQLATVKTQQIARPLKVLIPLIQGELQMGNNAGHDHYRRAGEMLIEAKDQVGYGGWNRWLKKNFELSRDTASSYMRLATAHREFAAGGRQDRPTSLREVTGKTNREELELSRVVAMNLLPAAA